MGLLKYLNCTAARSHKKKKTPNTIQERDPSVSSQEYVVVDNKLEENGSTCLLDNNIDPEKGNYESVDDMDDVLNTHIQNTPPRLRRRLSERVKSFRKLFQRRKRKQASEQSGGAGVSLEVREREDLTQDPDPIPDIRTEDFQPESEGQTPDPVVQKIQDREQDLIQFPEHLTEIETEGNVVINGHKLQEDRDRPLVNIPKIEYGKPQENIRTNAQINPDAAKLNFKSAAVNIITTNSVAVALTGDKSTTQPDQKQQAVPAASEQQPLDFGAESYGLRKRNVVVTRAHSDDDVQHFMEGLESHKPKPTVVRHQSYPGKPTQTTFYSHTTTTMKKPASKMPTKQPPPKPVGPKPEGRKMNIPKLIVEGCMNFGTDQSGEYKKGLVEEESEEELMTLADRSPHFNKRNITEILPKTTSPIATSYEARKGDIAYIASCLDTLEQDETGERSDSTISTHGSDNSSDTWTHGTTNESYENDVVHGASGCVSTPPSDSSISLPSSFLVKEAQEVLQQLHHEAVNQKSQSDGSIPGNKADMLELCCVDERRKEEDDEMEEEGDKEVEKILKESEAVPGDTAGKGDTLGTDPRNTLVEENHTPGTVDIPGTDLGSLQTVASCHDADTNASALTIGDTASEGKDSVIHAGENERETPITYEVPHNNITKNKSYDWNGQSLRVCTLKECLACTDVTSFWSAQDMPEELQYLQISHEDYSTVCKELKKCEKVRRYSLCYNRWLHSCFFMVIFVVTWSTAFAIWTTQGLAARTGAGVMFLLAVAVTIFSSCVCCCFKRKFDIQCRHVLWKVNELLSKYNIILGLMEDGALSCYRLSLHMLYFDTGPCLERLTEDLNKRVERKSSKKKHKVTDTFVETDMAVLSGDITEKQRQEFSRQLLWRYCDPFINAILRGRTRRLQSGKRHSTHGPCLCQFIQQRFFNLREEDLA